MKFWTKILVAVLTFAMIASMAVACKKDDGTTDDGSKAESTTAKPTETKPNETKAPDTNGETDPVTPDESKPEDTPAESKPEDTPAESKPEDTPAESKPEDTPAESKPEDTPAESKPEDTPAETKPVTPDEPEDPTAPDAQPDAVDINTALTGFISGDALDAKLVATNGYLGTEFWTGTTLPGYAIMSTNPNMDDTRAAIAFEISVTEFSLLKFNVKVDSDIGDVFMVYLDNKPYNGVGSLDAGEHEIAIPISEGEHNVALMYIKDDSGFDGTDTAYVSAGTLEPLATAIDGAKDEFYDDAEMIMVRNPYRSNPQTWVGGGTAYMKNDAYGIYLYIDVIDQAVVEDSDGDFDNEDKVQLYIDFARSYMDEGVEGLDYRNTASEGGMKMGWINCNPAGDNNPTGTFGGNYGFRNLTAFTAASTITETGYAVEFFIPIAHEWLQDDNMIGLGIQISDDTPDEDTDPNASFYSKPDAEGASTWYSYYDTLPEVELKFN